MFFANGDMRWNTILTEKTNLIKSLSKSITSNFIEIGNLLKEVRDKEIYNEKYTCLKDYLKEEDLGFGPGFAYRLIHVMDDPKLVTLVSLKGISKAIELTYVPDREIRDDLIKRVESGEIGTKRDLTEEVKRIRQLRTDRPPQLNTEEERQFKSLNEFEKIQTALIDISQAIAELWIKYQEWKKTASEELKIKIDACWKASKEKI